MRSRLVSVFIMVLIIQEYVLTFNFSNKGQGININRFVFLELSFSGRFFLCFYNNLRAMVIWS